MLHRFLLYVGSFGSAEAVMSQTGYVPSQARGWIILAIAFSADMLRALLKSTSH